MARSLVVLFLAIAGCGVTTDAAPESTPPTASAVEQSVNSGCLLLCKKVELTCMQTCTQDPNGGDCGCTEDYLACRATC
jgi:hypothetical protein